MSNDAWAEVMIHTASWKKGVRQSGSAWSKIDSYPKPHSRGSGHLCSRSDLATFTVQIDSP